MGGKPAFNAGLVLAMAQQAPGNLGPQQHLQGVKK